ncbi:ecdysteroid-phosphate phosphatase isoform X2 [Aricia agestis]|uniref:ecdysteroid-phosphate phosphatase isoform X2 n=1 Tax=Aricia agestis TaxID=91739 RepID=UPI001C2073D7|nr:ecdysteroid-phosphate phosphatase isoform X2 [Aricia agestis]
MKVFFCIKNAARVIENLLSKSTPYSGVSLYFRELPGFNTHKTRVLKRTMSEKHNTSDSMEKNKNTYPYEDAEKMGLEQSEKSFSEWSDYWESVRQDKQPNVLKDMHEPGYDWKANVNGGNHSTVDTKYESKSSSKNDEASRWVFAMRHGERVDLTYGSWVPYCFDENGTYTRKDLNMPEKLTERVGGAESYARDSPLTRVGALQAALVGEGLRAAGVRLRHVYASAALRSVATAHHMLKGLQADPSVKIRVEPGIFEYKKWYAAKGLAPFMTPQELHNAGYNVDLNYKPYVNLGLNTDETVEEYYQRNEFVIHSAVRDTKEEGGNIIFVGHAATLEVTATALHRLEKKEEFPPYEISDTLLLVPYCAIAALREGPWRLVAPPCPPFASTSSGRFNWKILQDIVAPSQEK